MINGNGTGTEYLIEMLEQPMTHAPVIPVDAFYTTWDHINQLAGLTFTAGMVVGAICLYAAPKVAQRIVVLINSERTTREPHAQRSNHPAPRDTSEELEDDDQVTV